MESACSRCAIEHMVLISRLNLVYRDPASAPDRTNLFQSRRKRPNGDRMMSFSCYLETGELLKMGPSLPHV